METLLMEEGGQIRRDSKYGLDPSPARMKSNRCWMVLAIEGDTQLAASFERRQLISAGEPRHMDHLRFEPWSEAIVIQNGGRGRR